MQELEVVRTAGASGSTEIVRVKGALTLSTSASLQDNFRELRGRDTVIDVSEVRYIDSSGLGTLLSHWARTQRTGNKFALSGANPRVDMLLEITGLKAVIPIFRTAEEADAKFTQPA